MEAMESTPVQGSSEEQVELNAADAPIEKLQDIMETDEPMGDAGPVPLPQKQYFPNPYVASVTTQAGSSDSEAMNMPPALHPDATPDVLTALKTETVNLCEKIVANCKPSDHQAPWDVYNGYSGLARLFLKIHECDPACQIHGLSALILAEQYMDTAIANCNSFLRQLKDAKIVCHDVGYLRSQGGVWATGALVYHHTGNNERSAFCLAQLVSMKHMALSANCSQDFSYGRPGYLYALLYVRRYLTNAHETITNDLVEAILNTVLNDGAEGAKRQFYGPSDRRGHKMDFGQTRSPFIWLWYMERYLGAAHGMAGALTSVLSVPSSLLKAVNEAETDDMPREPAGEEERAKVTHVERALKYLQSRKLANGSYMLRIDDTRTNSSQLFEEKEFVQFCHGAPGVALCLCRGYEVYKKEEYLSAAKEAADLVWKRGLIRKGVGLCHGISGNAYLFLTLYRLTNDIAYWQRAQCFANVAINWDTTYAPQLTSDRTTSPAQKYGLFDGIGGLAHLVADMGFWKEEVFVGFPGFADAFLE
ncbi:hypothetical protein SpCBS45565_g06388 [Spizellomyces sp. 'palustris']|nr:hypothetical protein SpCBS45565_g06388 [Spizellomyces sp. 'palustris']